MVTFVGRPARGGLLASTVEADRPGNGAGALTLRGETT
jgi:hypothetical protein